MTPLVYVFVCELFAPDNRNHCVTNLWNVFVVQSPPAAGANDVFVRGSGTVTVKCDPATLGNGVDIDNADGTVGQTLNNQCM